MRWHTHSSRIDRRTRGAVASNVETPIERSFSCKCLETFAIMPGAVSPYNRDISPASKWISSRVFKAFLYALTAANAAGERVEKLDWLVEYT